MKASLRSAGPCLFVRWVKLYISLIKFEKPCCKMLTHGERADSVRFADRECSCRVWARCPAQLASGSGILPGL